MTALKKGLGRGFESLIPIDADVVEESFDPTREEDAKVSQLKEIAITEIVRDEEQPRKNFTEESLRELAASIKEHGVLQPLVVVRKGDKYQIVAGERRWRASKLAGRETVPAIVRTLDDQNKLELSIIENAQREDLNPIELATAYAKLKAQFNLGNEEIAKRVGKSPSSIVNTMRLLKLPEEAKSAIQEHNLTEGTMRPLIVADPEVVREVLPKLISEGWSTRKVEQYIASKKKKSSGAAVKTHEFLKEEKKIGEALGCGVRIRGRSITLSVKNEKALRELIEKLK